MLPRFVRCSWISLILACGLIAPSPSSGDENAPDERPVYDVVVYGASSAGLAAAIQVKRMQGSVIVVEPSRRIGGLTTGGLGQTDIGKKAAIGGVSREFYQRVRKHYQKPSSWRWQKQGEYRSGGQSRTSSQEETMWTFEPSAALSIYKDWMAELDIRIVMEQRLDRTPIKGSQHRIRGVEMDGTRISRIRMESGETYQGRHFIDATYEGDLLAGAGVSFIVGREANSKYDETLSGVQTRRAIHHQFKDGVDPYVKAGQPESGLLPGIDPDGPGVEGEGDLRVQAYCFRMCLTDHPENRIPFARPADYDEKNYELLLRNFEAGAKVIPWANSPMPNRKTDTNNNRGFSTDFIGQNYDYPLASYEERERIVAAHRSYQQGLMWTLANHPRVPESIRSEVSRWGTSSDEFERQDGWQQQLYIREARRMIGDYVMTQHNCQGREVAPRPVGLAAYTMDSHNVQRHLGPDGTVRNEGDVQVGGFSPYAIDYHSLLPRPEECSNLLVPVCLSATHMAFGSIRMEPVFMVLGQSSATAAMLSISKRTDLHKLDFGLLQDRLLKDRQVLKWTGPKRVAPVGMTLKSLKGIVADDASAEREGFDSVSTSIGPFVELGYRHDSNTAQGRQSIRYKLQVPKAGRYEVRLSWTAHSNRATNVPVTVTHAAGKSIVRINQRKKPSDGAFGSVGTFDFKAGTAVVEISNKEADGYVLADAVQLIAK